MIHLKWIWKQLLVQKGRKGNVVKDFKLIPLLKFSSLGTAKPTEEMFELASNPLVRNSAFPVFTEAFFDSTQGVSSTGTIKNMEYLTYLMKLILHNIVAKLKTNRIQNRGTTKWRDISKATKTDYGPGLDDIPTTKNLFFLSSDHQ